MEKYKPIFAVTIAFSAAAWCYIYYADYQCAKAENMIGTENERQMEEFKKQKYEVSALHILVKTKDEAFEVQDRLLQGEDFEKLAKQYSFCPSGQKGGALGYFKRGQMVPEFEEVAFSLEKNEVSQPVKTDFGWHLIKVVDILYVSDKIRN